MEHFPERQAEAKAYAELLKGAGIERGLIGPREADRIWERHILNCIPVSTMMAKGAKVLDIGSGAGLPGVVIASPGSFKPIDSNNSLAPYEEVAG